MQRPHPPLLGGGGSPAALRRLEDAGVTRVVFEIGVSPVDEGNPPVPITAEALTRNLERVAEAVLARSLCSDA